MRFQMPTPERAREILKSAHSNLTMSFGTIRCLLCGDSETVGEGETKLHYECESILVSQAAERPFSFPIIA